MVPPLPWDVPGRLRIVDVSRANYLSRDDWDKIKASECVCASIKACESITVDDRFFDHANNAAAVDLDLQAYGFIHSATDGVIQAEATCRIIDRCPHPFRAREVMDWEDMKRVDPHQGGVGPAIALHNGLNFLRTMRKLRGRDPAVYSSKGFIDLFQSLFNDTAYHDDLLELGSYDLWVASYRWDPFTGHDYQIIVPKLPLPIWEEAYAWQARGNLGPSIVPGLKVPLDGDVFFGDRPAWDRWCADEPTREAGLKLGDDGAVTSLWDETHREQD